MWKDTIVEEVRKTREKHAAKFGYDLNAIYLDLKKHEKRNRLKVVSLPAKQLIKIAKAS
ncbi:MAG: hypothetical protein HY759_06400 [Nitrospirae bacterium]|nr:hypothetical protein [Nitrospirota bacterium]